MAFQGIDIRQIGDRIVFRALLYDSNNAILTSGTTNLRLYELQNDGTIKSYDWNSSTFKTTALTTENQTMTHRTGNNSTTNTGIWTYALTTLSGFTAGNIYFASIVNTSALPNAQVREFQFGVASGSVDPFDITTIADAILVFDWTSASAPAARSVLNALRLLRNKWTISAGTLSVKKENDTDEAWNATVSTDAAADPITTVDPA